MSDVKKNEKQTQEKEHIAPETNQTDPAGCPADGLRLLRYFDYKEEGVRPAGVPLCQGPGR
jgi:hypothetical protein